MVALCPGNPADKIVSRFLPPKLSMSLPVNAGRRSFTFEKSSVNLVSPTGPTRVYKDNLACVAMSENPVRRKYSRHIDIRRFFVRDLVAQQVLKLPLNS